MRPPVVGLVPAAGQATRLGRLPGSKELYPVEWVDDGPGTALRVKVVSEGLLDSFQAADIETAFVVLRDGKWDIPAYWGDGAAVGMHLAYLTVSSSPSVPFTLNCAYPFVRDKVVALGFPDILFSPPDVYAQLLSRLYETGSDVVLGLFPAPHPERMDMVAVDDAGRPTRIDVKPSTTSLTHTWVCAVWAPAFGEYLHEAVAEAARDDAGELFLGSVFQRALDDGLAIQSVRIPGGRCLDLGTPDALVQDPARELRSSSG